MKSCQVKILDTGSILEKRSVAYTLFRPHFRFDINVSQTIIRNVLREKGSASFLRLWFSSINQYL